MSLKEKINPADYTLEQKLVSLKRVSKVTKGGRNFSFSALVVVGDGKGVVGYGLGKSNVVSDAISKGENAAKNRLVKIKLRKKTIPHEVQAKIDGGVVFLKPASEGTGVIAGGVTRDILELAGVQDVLSKSKGSSSPCNVVKATFAALESLRDPKEIAAARGISLDVLFHGPNNKNDTDTHKEK